MNEKIQNIQTIQQYKCQDNFDFHILKVYRRGYTVLNGGGCVHTSQYNQDKIVSINYKVKVECQSIYARLIE